MPDPGGRTPSAARVRRCSQDDWRDIRRLHIKMTLGIPLAVDVELNEVFATPDSVWLDYAQACALGAEQALFLAEADQECVGMGHVRLDRAQARLGMLFVDESVRGRGIGTALVAAQEEWARAAGAADLVCHIPDTSAAARLAPALGWQRTEEVFVAKNRLVERRWTKPVA